MFDSEEADEAGKELVLPFTTQEKLYLLKGRI